MEQLNRLEAATDGVLGKKLFLKILQNLHNNCDRVSILRNRLLQALSLQFY